MRHATALVLLSITCSAWAEPVPSQAVRPPAPFCDAALYQSSPARTSHLAAPDVAPQRITLPPTAQVPQQTVTGSSTDAIQIGYVQAAPTRLLDAAAWLPAPDGGSVMKVELTSPNAGALRVQVAGLGGAGIEIRPYAPGSKAVFGPYLLSSGGAGIPPPGGPNDAAPSARNHQHRICRLQQRL
jgi:hypothetical protein